MIDPTIIAALDRLNSHARAGGCGKRAIYEYKTLAALHLAHAGELVARPVGIRTKCQHCSGTGIYKDWDGVDRGACYRCGRSGYVHLRFAETKIGDVTWHHPWQSGGEEILRAAWKVRSFEYVHGLERVTFESGETRDVVYEDPGEWRPNSGGERASGEDAAALSNLVEDWVLSLHSIEERWRLSSARRAVNEYRLLVGYVGTACHYCGGERAGGQHRVTRFLEWVLPVCNDHSGMPIERWDNRVPEAAITPAVGAWLARRGWQRDMAPDVLESRGAA